MNSNQTTKPRQRWQIDFRWSWVTKEGENPDKEEEGGEKNKWLKNEWIKKVLRAEGRAHQAANAAEADKDF